MTDPSKMRSVDLTGGTAISQSTARPVWPRRLLVLLAALVGLAAFGYVLAGPLLTIESALDPADAIIVLGGDGPRRATRAGTLFTASIAPRVLVSGAGDCGIIRDLLIAAGVPPTAITLECLSRNTMENATLSAPFFRVAGVRRAILVTSWFHSRRALSCFEKVAPDIDFLSAPVMIPSLLDWQLSPVDAFRVLAEYPKLLWYEFYYSVAVLWGKP